jgi:hypothetical protein
MGRGEALMTAGYSGTPLARKLSLKPGLRAWFDNMPEGIAAELADSGVERLAAAEPPIDAAHIFVTRYGEMEQKIAALRPLLAPAGFLWVSWPKKAAKVPTDITEDRIREAILGRSDLVDVKVCAVDETWSGLKLMIRRERR